MISAIMELVQALTIRQIYRMSTMYWDDKYGIHSVSNEASYRLSACGKFVYNNVPCFLTLSASRLLLK